MPPASLPEVAAPAGAFGADVLPSRPPTASSRAPACATGRPDLPTRSLGAWGRQALRWEGRGALRRGAVRWGEWQCGAMRWGEGQRGAVRWCEGQFGAVRWCEGQRGAVRLGAARSRERAQRARYGGHGTSPPGSLSSRRPFPALALPLRRHVHHFPGSGAEQLPRGLSVASAAGSVPSPSFCLFPLPRSASSGHFASHLPVLM